MTDEAAVPRLRRGMKLRFDEVRGQWVLLGPERAFVPDETGAELLRLIDGTRDAGAIIDDLARRYAAPRGVIAGDILAALDDLAARGAVTL